MNLKEKTVVIDNKIYRYSKIVMLNTNKAENFPFLQNTNGRSNQLYIPTKGYYYTQAYLKDNQFEAQHLYFLSSDKICEGDWFYDTRDRIVSNKCLVQTMFSIKIIATTDSSLFGPFEKPYPKEVTNPLPEPSQSFIEKYIEEYNKGNVITEVMVEYEEFILNLSRENKPNQIQNRLKVNPKDNTITIRKVKDSWSREEVIELLNEVYQLGFNNNYSEIPDLKEMMELENFIEENL